MPQLAEIGDGDPESAGEAAEDVRSRSVLTQLDVTDGLFGDAGTDSEFALV